MFPTQRAVIHDNFLDIIDDFTNAFFDSDQRVRDMFKNKAEFPKTDIYIEDNNLIFKMAVPGIKKDELQVSIEDNILTISSQYCKEKEEKKEEGQSTILRKEIKKGSFTRSWNFDQWETNIQDAESVNTSLENGMLTVEIPILTQAAESKKIDISIK